MANTSPTGLSPIPPLESGDRLSRDEFERRYQAMPKVEKAELIEGVVYVASPLRFKSHAQPHSNLMGWLWTYAIATPGVELGDNPTVRLDLDNEVQPDAVLLITQNAGGQSRLGADDYIELAPELVVEVAASNAANDLYDKKNVYRRTGVKEYIVWQTFEKKLDWFFWQRGDYITLAAAEGIIQSRVFPGLCLDVPALLAGDMTKVLAVLQAKLNSTQHAEFVQRLTQNVSLSFPK